MCQDGFSTIKRRKQKLRDKSCCELVCGFYLSLRENFFNRERELNNGVTALKTDLRRRTKVARRKLTAMFSVQ